MKWFTYLLRHGIVVALVIGIAIAYVYRQQLFPKFFEQGTGDITVANQTDKEAFNQSAKDAGAVMDADKTTQQDLSIVEPTEAGKAITSTSTADHSTREVQAVDMGSLDGSDTSKAQMETSAKTAPTSQVTDVSPQKQLADVTTAGQQQIEKTTPSLVDKMADKSDASIVKMANDSPKEATKSEGAVQDKKEMAQSAGGAADPAKMASGMMKDPLKSMSGMIQDPGKAMSGMMNPSTPGSSVVASDSANTQTQAAVPEDSSSQTQFEQGSSAMNRQQVPVPPAGRGMHSTEVPPQQQYIQIINQARHAYWQGQYQQSVAHYEQAIKLMPESADGYGELGNVHYAQGEWDKAGESLYQAAIRLLDKGQKDKAYNMLLIIRGLKHERAAELEKRLQGLQSGQ